MTKQTINIGTSENSNNGDPLRTAFTKINENFDELYDSNTLADSPGDFGSTIIPKTDGTYDLGSTTNKWDEIDSNQVYARDWVSINGSRLSVDANGNLNFSGVINATVRTKQDIQGDIFADDSTRVFDSASGIFTADLKGSVFADDSTLLVDGVNGTISWNVISGTPTTLAGFGIIDGQAFVASPSANWAGIAPTTLSEAVNRLANAYVSQHSSQIP